MPKSGIKKNTKGGQLMSKTITLRLSDKEYNLYSQVAQAAKRPISNLINYLAEKKIRGRSFCRSNRDG
jgi:hypothetical protein